MTHGVQLRLRHIDEYSAGSAHRKQAKNIVGSGLCPEMTHRVTKRFGSTKLITDGMIEKVYGINPYTIKHKQDDGVRNTLMKKDLKFEEGVEISDGNCIILKSKF